MQPALAARQPKAVTMWMTISTRTPFAWSWKRGEHPRPHSNAASVSAMAAPRA